MLRKQTPPNLGVILEIRLLERLHVRISEFLCLNIEKTRTTFSQQKQLEERRRRITTIIKQEDIKEISSNNSGSTLLRYKPENYSSEIFSSLAFEDIKKAHEESIIPINQDDIINFKTRNLAQLERDRNMKIEMP